MAEWVVTVMVEDGSWVPLEVEADTMADAVDCAFALGWVENVVECQPKVEGAVRRRTVSAHLHGGLARSDR